MIGKLRLAAAKGLAHRIARQTKLLGYAPERLPALAPQPDLPDGLHRQHLLGPPFAELTKGASWLRAGQFSTPITSKYGAFLHADSQTGLTLQFLVSASKYLVEPI